MLVVCGIAERGGKVLVCRRGAGVPYAGAWEFPSEELQEGETLENSVETAFFDRNAAFLHVRFRHGARVPDFHVQGKFFGYNREPKWLLGCPLGA